MMVMVMMVNGDEYCGQLRSLPSMDGRERCRPLLPAACTLAAKVGHVRSVKPNAHRRRRRDSAVELSRVGGVNAPSAVVT